MAATMRTRRRLWWSIALVGVAAGAGVWVAGWRSIALQTDQLAHARGAYEERDWDRAAAEARRRLETSGDDLEALRLYARASIRRNRDDVGNAIYKDRLGPERLQPEDYFLVGLSLARLGRHESALKVWEQGALRGADHPELLESLARQALALGAADTADDAARRLARLPGCEARGLLLVGEAQYQLDDPVAAAAAIDRGLRDDRALLLSLAEDPDALARRRRLLARCWLKLGKPAQAAALLEQVLHAGPGSPPSTDREAEWLLSRAWLQQGRLAGWR